jgi:uncharacterized metal-binding protein YceD (DUF177 family)
MRTPALPVEPWSHIVRLDDTGRTPIDFDVAPSAEACAELAARLGILGLRKLRLKGRLASEGGRDWRLAATLGATAQQACVVTLAPVTTRIEETVDRRYAAHLPELPPTEEVEMPDETVEPLARAVDLGAIMAEALALALPAWPRAEGAEVGQRTFARPGTRPMTDEDARPFAGLRDILSDRGDDT